MRDRYAHIDSIRAVAAMAVIYFHFAMAFVTSGAATPIEQHVFYAVTGGVDLGKLGVTLFFFVSGFVIPFSLIGRSRGAVASFIVGRVFRLYPAYWLSVLVALIIAVRLEHVAFSRITILANVAMLQDFVRLPSLQGLYWTLQIELVFYGLCVALFLGGLLDQVGAVRTTSFVMLGLALLLAVLRKTTGHALPIALPLGLYIMLMGLIWRMALLGGDAAARRVSRPQMVARAVVCPIIAVIGIADPGTL